MCFTFTDYDHINEIDGGSYLKKDSFKGDLEFSDSDHLSKHDPNDPYPYAVRVKAPLKFLTSTTNKPVSTTPKIKTTTPAPLSDLSFVEEDPMDAYLDTRGSEFAESHPHSVAVLPPAGLQTSSNNFQPILSESNRQQTFVQPPNYNILNIAPQHRVQKRTFSPHIPFQRRPNVFSIQNQRWSRKYYKRSSYNRVCKAE